MPFRTRAALRDMAAGNGLGDVVLTLAQLGDYFLDMSRTDEDTSLRQLWADLAADVDSYMAGHGPADTPPLLHIEVTS